MAPPRTFIEDPDFMVLYHGLKTLMDGGKIDYNAIAAKLGIVSAAAA
jgi:hypothetical protein